jgi:hypothetical protein
VFIVGLTDLEVRLEVIHRALPEHESRHYSSAGDAVFEPVLDAAAFSCA